MPKLTAAMLPHVRLSHDDEEELRTLSRDLEAEVVHSYEEFLFHNNRHVDKTRWRALRSHEDLHIYRERSDSHRDHHAASSPLGRRPLSTSSSSMSSSLKRGAFEPVSTPSSCSSYAPSTMEIGPLSAMAAQSSLPLVLLVGTVAGTLDDALHGLTFHDTASLGARNAYQKELFEDAAVLNVVDEATHEDPFQFLGVVWCLHSSPLGGLMRSRDMVALTQVRQSQLRNGELIGVVLNHSIRHRDLPELDEFSIIREHASSGMVLRQLDDQHIEVYLLEFADPNTHAPGRLVTQESAKALLTVANVCNTGLKKKLHWMLRDRRARERAYGRSITHTENADLGECPLCQKSLTGMFSSPGSVCQLCDSRVCSKCTVTKKIIVDARAVPMDTRSFDFCIACTMKAKEYSALDIVQQQVQEREQRQWSQRTKAENTQSHTSSRSNSHVHGHQYPRPLVTSALR